MIATKLAYYLGKRPRRISSHICGIFGRKWHAYTVGNSRRKVIDLVDKRVLKLPSAGRRSYHHDRPSGSWIAESKPAVILSFVHQFLSLGHNGTARPAVVHTGKHTVYVVVFLRKEKVHDPSTDDENPVNPYR